MHSMTGYGRGTCEVGGRRCVIELRSVNHRYLEVKARLPFADGAVETYLTQLLRARLHRGVITVSIRDEGSVATSSVRVDLSLAHSYARALSELREALGEMLDGQPLPLSLIASQPGVLTSGEGIPDGEALWSALRPGIEEALSALIDSRAREGAALTADLMGRVGRLEQLVAELGELTRDAPSAYRKRLSERIARVLGSPDVDPQRIAQEVAILADKIDVTEELTRVAAHLAETRRLLIETEVAGRRLDFLTQELNREINTIGSKSQSALVAAHVVEAKAELERLREQIQNVE